MIEDLWYKNTVIYSLDLETFMDANGDGVGDFEGLTRRLGYLQALGISTIWLSPFQPTPNRDNGYDISDFYGVDPRHGSSGDFVEFMQHAKKRGIEVIMDLVVNHSSDQHRWFQDSRTDKHSQYRDWYVWSKEASCELENRHGLSRCAEVDLDIRQRSTGILLSPLLRISTGSQHAQSSRAD